MTQKIAAAEIAAPDDDARGVRLTAEQASNRPGISAQSEEQFVGEKRPLLPLAADLLGNVDVQLDESLFIYRIGFPKRPPSGVDPVARQAICDQVDAYAIYDVVGGWWIHLVGQILQRVRHSRVFAVDGIAVDVRIQPDPDIAWRGYLSGRLVRAEIHVEPGPYDYVAVTEPPPATQ